MKNGKGTSVPETPTCQVTKSCACFIRRARAAHCGAIKQDRSHQKYCLFSGRVTREWRNGYRAKLFCVIGVPQKSSHEFACLGPFTWRTLLVFSPFLAQGQ